MRKGLIDRHLNEIKMLLNDDTYLLTRDEQDVLLMKLDMFKSAIDEIYGNKKKINYAYE